MFWRYIHSNLIKWWRIIYIPIARKIFPTKQEQEAYDNGDATDKDETTEESNHTSHKKKAAKEKIDPALLHNKNYNATTNAMSGEYGKKAVDEDTKEKIDSILSSNYSTSNIVDTVVSKQHDSEKTTSEPDSSASTTATSEKHETKEEHLRKANEIYERLLQEAKEDELKRQREIAAAMESSQH